MEVLFLFTFLLAIIFAKMSFLDTRDHENWSQNTILSIENPWCRACLATDVKMHWIENIDLLQLYEKLTNTKIAEDTKPNRLCYICLSLLQKCRRFSEMTLRSEKILRDFFYDGIQANTVVITPKQGTGHNLSITAVNTMCVNEPDFDSPNISYYEDVKDDITVKIEEANEDELGDNETSGFLEVEVGDILKKDQKKGEKKKSHEDSHCHVCNATFDTKHKLVVHMRLHTSGISCKICKINCQCEPSEQTTQTEKTQTDLNPLSCDQCGKNFSDKHCLIRHMKIHTGIKPYSCDRCTNTFIRLADLNSHFRIHTGEKPFSCKTCNKTFSMKHNLTRHARTHTGEKPYACSQCEKTFTEEGSLVVHTRIHTGEKPFTCDRCSKAFTKLSDLKIHMRIHTGEKPFACNSCNKSFTMKQHLKRHIRTHSGEKPFSCDRCSRGLASISDLKSHMRIHTGEKPFACISCDKTFSVKHNLTRHTRIHTGEKPFACDRCSKAFVGSSDLKNHMRMHSGEKPFSCTLCEKAFADRSSLSKHIRIHTGKNAYKLS